MLGWEKGEWSQKGREKPIRKNGGSFTPSLDSILYPWLWVQDFRYQETRKQICSAGLFSRMPGKWNFGTTQLAAKPFFLVQTLQICTSLYSIGPLTWSCTRQEVGEKWIVASLSYQVGKRIHWESRKIKKSIRYSIITRESTKIS